MIQSIGYPLAQLAALKFSGRWTICNLVDVSYRSEYDRRESVAAQLPNHALGWARS